MCTHIAAFVCCASLQLGGMGFVHYNNTIEEQVKHVTKAKQHCAGMVVTPMVLAPTDSIAKIDALKVRGSPL